MSRKITDRIFGLILLGGLAAFLIYFLPAVGGIATSFQGGALWETYTKLLLFLGTGILAGIALFIAHSKSREMVTLHAVVSVVIAWLWRTTPNHPDYQKALAEIQKLADQPTPGLMTHTVTVYSTSNIWLTACLVTLGYVWLVRPRLQDSSRI